MASNNGHVNIASDSHEEHDHQTYRKRVATHIDGNSVAYEDTNFTSGESPAVLDVFTDLGRIGLKGYFINDGPGDIKIEVSNDGVIYGSQMTIHGGEVLSLDDFMINRIRLTFVDPTEYRSMIG